MQSLAAQMHVVEAEELNSRAALDSTRDQLITVTEQYSQARQHICLLEASRSLLLSAVFQIVCFVVDTNRVRKLEIRKFVWSWSLLICLFFFPFVSHCCYTYSKCLFDLMFHYPVLTCSYCLNFFCHYHYIMSGHFRLMIICWTNEQWNKWTNEQI